MQIAVVGAGLAGLVAATDLRAAGHEVVVWEKSRGAGGRTSTRRGPHGRPFDHGAPFLHDGDHGLARLPALAEHHLVLPDGTTRVVTIGTPTANAPAKALAAGLEVRTGVRVGAIGRSAGRWVLADDRGLGLGEFDAVVVTAPAPQTAELLHDAAPELAAQARTVDFLPSWAVMAAWDHSLDLDFTGATDVEGLSSAVAESPKPGRDVGERWVLQASASLSQELLEDQPEVVAPLLVGRLAALAGRPLPAPTHLTAHRWRFARARTPLTEPCLASGRLVVAGDWCGGNTAGAAVRSGRAAAALLLR